MGSDKFNYTITDTTGATSSADVFITVIDTPPPPPTVKANDDTFRTTKNAQALPVNVLANDVGAGIHVTAVTQPSHGTATLVTATNGVNYSYVTYKPATDYVGPDSFTYTITDSSNATSTASVAVTVDDTTPPPPTVKANPDSFKVAKNSPPVPLPVMANDLGLGIHVTSVTQGAHGVVTLTNTTTADPNAPGGVIVGAIVSYAPNTDYVGPDHFSYTITDSSSATSTADVAISVEDNSPPPPPACKANPDTAIVPKNSPGQPLNVLGNDTGTGLVVVSVTQPDHGTASLGTAAGANVAAYVIYKPATDYVGGDHFTYTIKDANGATSTAEVTLTVVDTSPPPPPALKAVDDKARAVKNGPAVAINVIANDTGSGIKVTAVTQGAHGKVEILNNTTGAGGNIPTPGPGAVSYKPDTDFVGNDEFTYTITDATGATATAKVQVEVVDNTVPNPTPVPPTNFIYAVPDFAKVARNSKDNPINVLANDIGQNLTIVSFTQADHGTVVAGNVGLLYTPAADYFGPDKFTYKITNGVVQPAPAPGAIDPTIGLVTIYVDPGPPGPKVNPDFAMTQKNSPGVDINVLANDVGDHLTIASFTQPANGTVTQSVAGMALTYVPAKDFTGIDRFKYTAVDAKGQKGDADVAVNVLAAKPSPVLAHASPPIVPPGGTVAFFCDVLVDPATAGTAANAVVYTFAWDFGDGSTSDQRNPTHAYAAAGTYNAVVTVTNGKTAVGSATVTVLVKGDTGGLRAAFTVSFPVAIEGSEITFDGTLSFDPSNAIADYNWDFGDGTTGDMSIETHTYATAGEYKVTLTVTNEDGDTDSITRPIQVLPKDTTFKSRVRYTAKLNFTTANVDGLVVDSLLNVGSATVAAGTAVGIEIAGVEFTGKLDAKLQDTSSATERWQVKVGPTGSGVVALKFQVKNAALAKAFSDAGVVPPTTPAPVAVSIPVTITVDTASVPLTINSIAVFSRSNGKAVVAGDTNAVKTAKKASH